MSCGFDLGAIDRALRALQRDFGRVNATLDTPRDPMSDQVRDNLLCGYDYVNWLLGEGIDPLVLGNSAHLLHLNRLVLHGEAARDAGADKALLAAEQYFYDDSSGGSAGHLVAYAARHSEDPVWKRAAGVFIHVLSEPQLFVEGNHRTGSLVISYLLCAAGQGPFVLTPQNAKAFFDPASLVKACRKQSFRSLHEVPRLRKRLARVLRDSQTMTRYRHSGAAVPDGVEWTL